MIKKTISIHQPAYLPWLGYFDKIIRSDVFVILDTVQFEKNSFINRNQILSNQGPAWLTIPVKTKGHLTSSLQETEIDNTQYWQKKHLKSIELTYKKYPFFDLLFERIKSFYTTNYTHLAAFCFDQLMMWCDYFDIKTSIICSSDLDSTNEKSQLILSLCKQLEATHYLSGKFGADYLDMAAFKHANIDVEIQQFQSPIYPQRSSTFVPNLSILDYAMNCDTLF